MRTKTVVKLAKNTTPAERRMCRSLSYRGEGLIAGCLTTAAKKPRARVVMIKDEAGVIIAWGLLDTYTQLYVRQKYRKMGYGTRVIKHIKKFDPDPLVFKSDRGARQFFDKIGVMNKV